MGLTPIPPYRPPASPTRLEQAKADYVEGRISLETLEERAEVLLEAGVADDPSPIVPPRPRMTTSYR